MQDPDKEMLQRFFKGTCTVEETRMVKQYIATNPDALDTHMSEEDWLIFLKEQESVQNDKPLLIKRTEAFAGKGRVSIMRVMAVAASVLIVITLGWWQMKERAVKEKEPVAVNVMNDAGQQTAAPELVLIENTSGRSQRMMLPDSSELILYANSSVQYENPFPANNRTVMLKGKAMFDVRKDPAKSFTVYSGDLLTTALGTKFLVEEDHEGINVKLFNGKVSVRNRLDSNVIVLNPLQEISYRYLSGIMVKKSFNHQSSEKEDKVILAVKEKKKILSFDQTPVETVVERLMSVEKIEIIYKGLLSPNMTYTGSFDSGKESVEDFLQLLAKLNGFKIEKNGDVYSVIQP